MLVVQDAIHGNRRIWQYTCFASLLVAVLAMLSLGPYLTESTNVVKLRNALLLRDGVNTDFDWTPANVPADFKLKQGPIDPFFVEVADRLGLADLPGDWERTVAISSHLLRSRVKAGGGAIRSDLRRTYERITLQGDGYCGDFVRVFTAIATAGGMQVRNWAFSFDGFGGHGHIWPEVWNRQLQRWQLVGVFNNYYFFEEPGVPLSALAFREALLANSNTLKLAPIDPSSRVGWVHEEKAWAYYRRGLAQWYMWWGSDVFTYDAAPLVRLFSGRSRPMEQFAGIVQDVSPRLQVLLTPDNKQHLDALERLKHHVWTVIVVVMMALMAIVVSLWRWRPWRPVPGRAA
jgi:hypothetical protein